MRENTIECKGNAIKSITADVAVVGSGAAGFAAALRLRRLGVEDVVIVTEGVLVGTSRNTGSDKQTYYKLGLAGDVADSPADMARDFFAGGCVDGDIAYAEAASSARGFLNLAELGVPFPTNSLGEYVGYKTDHDARARATSAGPLTSKMMTECLERAVRDCGIPILDGILVTELLRDGQGKTIGLLGLDRSDDCRPIVLHAPSVILATGGPAGIYAASVYPECHNGASGIAFMAGAAGRNLTEWQYGLASVSPRWNVSGTYMQVLPRVFSVDAEGGEHEFLCDYFKDDGKSLSLLFRKGYEWPFDCRKARDGSSVIDLLVWYECSVKGRRVYLDYRNNPSFVENVDYSALDSEARAYLEATEACFGTPLDRLCHMNRPAYELYLSRGVDLAKEPLEIALCAQHNNGGIAVDKWWQSDIEGLFVAGEAAGTHGVRRPGGSALNAGQVGALRAAQYIAAHPRAHATEDAFAAIAAPAVEKLLADTDRMLAQDGTDVTDLRRRITEAMSASAGAIRDLAAIERLSADISAVLADYPTAVCVKSRRALYQALRLRDSLVTAYLCLEAILDYSKNGGASRGSAIYLERVDSFESLFAFREDNDAHSGEIAEIRLVNGTLTTSAHHRPVHPLPHGGGVFETVWRDYREGNLFE